MNIITAPKNTPAGKKTAVKKPESKTELFLRLVKPRVIKTLKSIRILSNCSNRSRYEYTSEQIDTIFLAIREALDKAEVKFTQSKTEQETFDF